MSLSADELPWGRPRPKFGEATLLAQDPTRAPSHALVDLGRVRLFRSVDGNGAIRQYRDREGRARTSVRSVFDDRAAVARRPDHYAAWRRACRGQRASPQVRSDCPASLRSFWSEAAHRGTPSKPSRTVVSALHIRSGAIATAVYIDFDQARDPISETGQGSLSQIKVGTAFVAYESLRSLQSRKEDLTMAQAATKLAVTREEKETAAPATREWSPFESL